MIHYFIKLFGCDTARIVRYPDRLFLIIGWHRNTRDGTGQWYRNGKPIEFDYTHKEVIASGETKEALMKAALKYKRLLAKGGA